MQDKKIIIFISIIFLAAIIAVYFYKSGSLGPSPISTADSLSSQNQNEKNLKVVDDITELEPREATINGITISIIPEISIKTWNFNIILDTHSGDLSEDLTQNSYLEDNQGNKYEPIAWLGDPPGGHHRSGVLRFNGVTPQPDTFKLAIVLGGESKIFSWENIIEPL